MVHRHILVQTFPSLGGLNPCLQLAKNLATKGVKVTMLVSMSMQHHVESNSRALKGLDIIAFSDGYDDGFKDLSNINYDHFMSQFRSHGSKALSDVITSSAREGFSVTRLVYPMNQTWAAEVARTYSIPMTVLWLQPATIFDIYFYYFDSFGDAIKKIANDPSSHIELPGLLPLTSQDLPSFMQPSNPTPFNQLQAFKEQLETLNLEVKPKVLVNTFDELESEALRAIKKYDLMPIGPLVPFACADHEDTSETSSGIDLLENSNIGYIKWLDSKPPNSVVYVSFGSIVTLSERQMEEISCGLLESRRPFLWVIKAIEIDKTMRRNPLRQFYEEFFPCSDGYEKQGMIIRWCSQVEVLSHPSLGCFLTHCGWNSTLESLVSGVPVVGLPYFTDQPTNAKLLQDGFQTGVRAKVNDQGVAEGGEIKRCIDLVMGCNEKGEEMRRNAEKWKYLAREAVKEGGSSYKNLSAFVDEVE